MLLDLGDDAAALAGGGQDDLLVDEAMVSMLMTRTFMPTALGQHGRASLVIRPVGDDGNVAAVGQLALAIWNS